MYKIVFIFIYVVVKIKRGKRWDEIARKESPPVLLFGSRVSRSEKAVDAGKRWCILSNDRLVDRRFRLFACDFVCCWFLFVCVSEGKDEKTTMMRRVLADERSWTHT